MHGLNLVKRVASRISLVFVIGLVLAATASAYTVVMHGGRRVEIPAQFIVTASTLTYEVSPGVQITLAMAAIDIPATEKVNNELPGSFLRRARSGSMQEAVDDKPTVRTVQTRTITNRDLESSRRRRRDSELAYETRRKQLGLPSVAESRKQAVAEADLIGIELEQKRAAEKESEDYWRGRAGTLRTEMAALDAELAYIRARLDEGPLLPSSGWSSVSFNTFTPGRPFSNFGRRSFGNFGGRAGFPAHPQHRPSIFVVPHASAQATGRVAFGGGATRAQVFINPGTFRHARPVGVSGRFSTFPNVVFGSVLPAYDYSYERGALVTRFNELAAARAGLSARWRELEDEARRAGAPPGWLRP
jgi:hypothetical protein